MTNNRTIVALISVTTLVLDAAAFVAALTVWS
jgi:hypothetical protein